MDQPLPIIILRGFLSPSTISLSSPDLDSTIITLSLELSLRNSSGPITVFPDGSFLSSRAQGHYSSDYGLYDTETGSKRSAWKPTCCLPSRYIYIKDPEEELLELGSLNAGESGTARAPTDTDDSRHSLHPQYNEQQSLKIKVDIGVYKDSYPSTTTTDDSNESIAPDKAVEREENGTSNPLAQSKQQCLRDLSIYATDLSRLVPGRQYEVRLERTPGRPPCCFWWWSRGAKGDIIADRHKRGPNVLAGPVTALDTGEQLYAVQRLQPWELNVLAKMVECPILTVTA